MREQDELALVRAIRSLPKLQTNRFIIAVAMAAIPSASSPQIQLSPVGKPKNRNGKIAIAGRTFSVRQSK